jgi:redox-sensitive bicupin YhaK (pirin superfamily)
VSEDRNQALVPSSANILDQGDEVLIEGGEAGAKLLLIAGRPIGEPIVQYGPFVMNTTAEIEQALADYRDGTLTA